MVIVWPFLVGIVWVLMVNIWLLLVVIVWLFFLGIVWLLMVIVWLFQVEECKKCCSGPSCNANLVLSGFTDSGAADVYPGILTFILGVVALLVSKH